MKILASNTRTSTYCKCLIFVTSIFILSVHVNDNKRNEREKKGGGGRQDTNLTKKGNFAYFDK